MPCLFIPFIIFRKFILFSPICQPPLFADPADRASAESDRAFTLRIRDRERRLIRKIQAALQRIDDGTYGLCEDCGEEISIARLKARPVTKLCINCKSRQEEGEDIRGE